MLVIRSAQMNAFREAAKKDFVKKVCDHLKTLHLPLLTSISDAALVEAVRGSLRKAEEYDFSTEHDCARFCTIAGEHGWKFDEMPEHQWMLGYLRDEEIRPPGKRLDLLIDQIELRKRINESNRKKRDSFVLSPSKPEDIEEIDELDDEDEDDDYDTPQLADKTVSGIVPDSLEENYTARPLTISAPVADFGDPKHMER